MSYLQITNSEIKGKYNVEIHENGTIVEILSKDRSLEEANPLLVFYQRIFDYGYRHAQKVILNKLRN